MGRLIESQNNAGFRLEEPGFTCPQDDCDVG